MGNWYVWHFERSQDKNALAFEMDTYYNGSGSELGIDVIGDGQTQNLQK